MGGHERGAGCGVLWRRLSAQCVVCSGGVFAAEGQAAVDMGDEASVAQFVARAQELAQLRAANPNES